MVALGVMVVMGKYWVMLAALILMAKNDFVAGKDGKLDGCDGL
jgi:hypothetical protein